VDWLIGFSPGFLAPDDYRVRWLLATANARAGPGIVVECTTVFVASLQGVITQILRHRLKVAPTKQKAFIANTCRMLIKGVR
jgi:hypothetical protein